jgi:hypothetical protein
MLSSTLPPDFVERCNHFLNAFVDCCDLFYVWVVPTYVSTVGARRFGVCDHHDWQGTDKRRAKLRARSAIRVRRVIHYDENDIRGANATNVGDCTGRLALSWVRHPVVCDGKPFGFETFGDVMNRVGVFKATRNVHTWLVDRHVGVYAPKLQHWHFLATDLEPRGRQRPGPGSVASTA